MPRKGYVWVQAPPTFNPQEKSAFFEQLKEFINNSKTLKEKIGSFTMRKNFLYLYENLVPDKPEVDGEYIKWNYARITFKDKSGNNCTADWQRANEQWIEFHNGTFIECLKYIDEGNGFFS